MLDVAVIGCGIVGANVAYLLSQHKLRAAVFEKENDVSMGTTRANSAIVHAGYDPEPGTAMARLNVRGSALTKEQCAAFDVKYRQIGSLVLAFPMRKWQPCAACTKTVWRTACPACAC
jgi:glycerol-3-phosphate dehydrogenase